MDAKEKRKLSSIANKLEKLSKEIFELIGDESDNTTRDKESKANTVSDFLNNLNTLTSDEVETNLQSFNHKELGDIFVEVGGSSGDKRKPKVWLIERILWLSKEFIEGHKAIRDQ